jgi:hypothetical protein
MRPTTGGASRSRRRPPRPSRPEQPLRTMPARRRDEALSRAREPPAPKGPPRRYPASAPTWRYSLWARRADVPSAALTSSFRRAPEACERSKRPLVQKRQPESDHAAEDSCTCAFPSPRVRPLAPDPLAVADGDHRGGGRGTSAAGIPVTVAAQRSPRVAGLSRPAAVPPSSKSFSGPKQTLTVSAPNQSDYSPCHCQPQQH